MQKPRGVKSLMEIQAEEARKAQQQEQFKQQQYRQQQQQAQQQKVCKIALSRIYTRRFCMLTQNFKISKRNPSKKSKKSKNRAIKSLY